MNKEKGTLKRYHFIIQNSLFIIRCYSGRAFHPEKDYIVLPTLAIKSAVRAE